MTTHCKLCKGALADEEREDGICECCLVDDFDGMDLEEKLEVLLA